MESSMSVNNSAGGSSFNKASFTKDSTASAAIENERPLRPALSIYERNRAAERHPKFTNKIEDDVPYRCRWGEEPIKPGDIPCVSDQILLKRKEAFAKEIFGLLQKEGLIPLESVFDAEADIGKAIMSAIGDEDKDGYFGLNIDQMVGNLEAEMEISNKENYARGIFAKLRKYYNPQIQDFKPDLDVDIEEAGINDQKAILKEAGFFDEVQDPYDLNQVQAFFKNKYQAEMDESFEKVAGAYVSAYCIESRDAKENAVCIVDDFRVTPASLRRLSQDRYGRMRCDCLVFAFIYQAIFEAAGLEAVPYVTGLSQDGQMSGHVQMLGVTGVISKAKLPESMREDQKTLKKFFDNPEEAFLVPKQRAEELIIIAKKDGLPTEFVALLEGFQSKENKEPFLAVNNNRGISARYDLPTERNIRYTSHTMLIESNLIAGEDGVLVGKFGEEALALYTQRDKLVAIADMKESLERALYVQNAGNNIQKLLVAKNAPKEAKEYGQALKKYRDLVEKNELLLAETTKLSEGKKKAEGLKQLKKVTEEIQQVQQQLKDTSLVKAAGEWYYSTIQNEIELADPTEKAEIIETQFKTLRSWITDARNKKKAVHIRVPDLPENAFPVAFVIGAKTDNGRGMRWIVFENKQEAEVVFDKYFNNFVFIDPMKDLVDYYFTAFKNGERKTS